MHLFRADFFRLLKSRCGLPARPSGSGLCGVALRRVKLYRGFSAGLPPVQFFSEHIALYFGGTPFPAAVRIEPITLGVVSASGAFVPNALPLSFATIYCREMGFTSCRYPIFALGSHRRISTNSLRLYRS